MTNFKKASLAAILILVLIVGITIASFAENSGTITKEAKLRKIASNDSTVLEIIPNKEEVEILAEDGDWYQVKYNKIKGYVLKDYIKVKEQVTQTNNTTTQDTNAKAQEIKKGAVITTNAETSLYIRPLINSKVITTLEKGKSIAIIEVVNEWAYVNIDTSNGWVRIDSLAITNNENSNSNSEESTALNKTGYITSTGINFREEPNTNSKVLKVFAQNAKVTILSENGDWYKVKSNDETGYVMKTYVSDKKVETTSRGSINRTENTTKANETNTNKTTTNTKSTTNNSTETTKTTNTKTSSKGQEVANYAKQFVGCKYVYGGASTNGFDCSGLTMYVYKKFGISLAHSATAQSKTGTTVSRNNLQPGDLVFFKNYRTNKGIGHVGIYIGNNKFVHASTEKTGVITSSLSGSYSSRYVTATRIF